MKKTLLCIAVLVAIPVCMMAREKRALATAKKEITEAEEAFCKLAKDSGLAVAFVAYAADDAVICRDPEAYKGKNAIREYYSKSDPADRLIWKPSFADVAKSCDLGYTWGEYDFSGTRAGKTVTAHGIFHTVWRKQKDGKWKFVVD